MIKFPSHIPYKYGLDFGYNDPTSLVKVGIDDNILYLEEVLYESNLGITQVIEKMKALNIQGDIICDNAGASQIADLTLKGFTAIKCQKKSIVEGIKELQTMDIRIVRRSKNLIHECNNYKWDVKNPNKPIDKFNHALDAVRYVKTYRKRRSAFIG